MYVMPKLTFVSFFMFFLHPSLVSSHPFHEILFITSGILDSLSQRLCNRKYLFLVLFNPYNGS